MLWGPWGAHSYKEGRWERLSAGTVTPGPCGCSGPTTKLDRNSQGRGPGGLGVGREPPTGLAVKTPKGWTGEVAVEDGLEFLGTAKGGVTAGPSSPASGMCPRETRTHVRTNTRT